MAMCVIWRLSLAGQTGLRMQMPLISVQKTKWCTSGVFRINIKSFRRQGTQPLVKRLSCSLLFINVKQYVRGDYNGKEQ